MTYEAILYDVHEGVATITLNRSESRNALNGVMYRDLMQAFDEISRTPHIRAVVLTGAGKGFCSGQDLGELNDLVAQGMTVGDMLRANLNQLVLNIRALEKPVIGALNGVAAGAGASLALATDLRIASQEASFVFAAFVNIGIIPDGGGTYLLPHLVGTSKALELAWLADAQNRVSAQTALTLGVVNRVVPHESLMAEAQTLAQKLASMATLALGKTKRAIYSARETTFESALAHEADTQERMFQTHDFSEGVRAFLEKRPAQFKGE
jgi:2-(1,2-epoxy-1,2-dihydrophenyl)acetyl-CoA isomerase